MGNLFRAFLAITFLVAGSICFFSLASRGSGSDRGDLAVLVGSGTYGSFLTDAQKDQLEIVVRGWHQGNFLDILVAAPDSLVATGHPPFAIAEYLEARGIRTSNLRVDDEIRSFAGLARKTRRLMGFGNYQQPLVFAAQFDLPLAKFVMGREAVNASFIPMPSPAIGINEAFTASRPITNFAQFDLPLAKFVMGREAVNASFIPMAGLGIGQIPGIAAEFATMAGVVAGFDTPAVTEPGALAVATRMEEDLLFKPLDLMSSNETSIAWSRVRSTVASRSPVKPN